MKIVKGTFILLFIATFLFAQEESTISNTDKSQESVSYEEGSPEYNKAKVQRFKKLRTSGIVLLSTGVVAIAGGISMIASAGTASYQVTYSNGSSSESGDPVGGFGAVIVSLGIPMTVAGIVLTKIGGKKVREYQNLLCNNSGIDLKVSINRLCMIYNF